MWINPVRTAGGGALICALAVWADTLSAQARTVSDSLVREALTQNPRIRAASSHVDAARERMRPAGLWPDPMLMAGVQNLPLTRDRSVNAMSGPDAMTMKMVGVSQTVPYPGKTSLRASVARAEVEVAEARRGQTRVDVRRDVMNAYYDLVAARMMLNVLDWQQGVVTSLQPAAEARYLAGTTMQADVIKARTEAPQLEKEVNAARQEERSALAGLAAALGGGDVNTISVDSFPAQLRSAPMPRLAELQSRASRENPRLRERRAMLATQRAAAELSAREYLPDFDFSVQYGQRNLRPDMISVAIAVAVPVQRSRKQGASARAARFDAASTEGELAAEENAVRADVSRVYADIERHRANLELLDRAILPQTRATVASASATFQAGRTEMLSVLDAIRAQFTAEQMYVRTLAEYAKTLNEMEALVGGEVWQ